MNNKTNIVIGAIAVIALILGAWAILKNPIVNSSPMSFGGVSNTNAPAAGSIVGSSTVLPNPSVFDYLVSRTYMYVDNAFGWGNGTSVPTNEQVIRQSLVSGTSTPCAIQNPLNATSTLLSFAYNITTATSSAMTYAIGTSSTAYATSTSMANLSVGASQQSTLSWIPGVNNAIIGPKQYVVVGENASGFFTTGVVTAGSCTGVFMSVN